MGGEVYALFREFKTFSNAVRVVIRNLFRQALWLNRVGCLERHRTFNGVFQFTHVAWPDIALQQAHCILADRQLASCARTKLPDEMLRQFANVFRSLAQRWKLNRDHRNTIKQVFAKSSV